MPSDLENRAENAGFDVIFPISPGSTRVSRKARESPAAIQPTAALKPKAVSSTPPRKKTHTLQGVLGAREDRHPLEQLLLPLLLIIRCFWHHRLDGALGTHLVEIFGDATDGLSRHHVDHAQQLRPPGCDRDQHQQ